MFGQVVGRLTRAVIQKRSLVLKGKKANADAVLLPLGDDRLQQRLEAVAIGRALDVDEDLHGRTSSSSEM
jgi:hypothetical protein